MITDSPVAAALAKALKDEAFTLIDVGCSGGIQPAWRIFGDRLRALGFDPNRFEVARLADGETNPQVRYIEGFVGLPDGHPLKGASADPWRVDPWGRLSAYRTQDLQGQRAAAAAAASESAPAAPALAPEDLTERNLWREADLADAARTLVLPQVFAEQGLDDIDFIKIDVDGVDFEILQSLGDSFADKRVLGAMLEVNFFGTDAEQYNTFHNIDRFMRAQGFDLLDLTVRRYSLAALPSPYLYPHPLASQTANGRPFQGDAVYLRDFGYPWDGRDPDGWSDDKLIKLLALYVLFDRADHAAELLRLHPARFAGIDIAAMLDGLAREAQAGREGPPFADYAAYIAAFEADDPAFYGEEARLAALSAPPDPGLAQAAQAEHAALAGALEEALAQVHEVETQLRAMRSSTSWKLTAPIRALARRLGR